MLPRPKNYAIYPAVIPADQPVEMTIVPNERLFLLRENETYDLTVIDVSGDEPDYYEKLSCHTHLSAVAHGGVLCFSYTFSGEQEHTIRLMQGGVLLGEVSVYSLYEDMYGLLALKGDLHSHSHRSDGRRDPAALAGHFREQGYDFFALTDHNRYYTGGEIDEVYEGVKLGITRIRGEEVHAPGSVIHIVHVGGAYSVAERYVNDRESYEREIVEYRAKVPEHIPERFVDRYAKTMWATDKIHEAGGLAIFPHPYWKPSNSMVYNVCDELSELLLTSGMFDAYELSGAMKQPGINRSVALWADLRAEKGLKIPVVGSSDVHRLEESGSFPHSYTICFAADNSHDAIIDAVKAGRTVVIEDTGDEYDRQYRCYGSLRSVAYAHFLLNHFFLERQRICQGEGVAMRNYGMGIVEKELIELQVKQSDDFRDRFFGRKAPVLPDQTMLAFENKWRERQLRGPLTKGSRIDSDKITRQI
ncbi:MAG: hypothetical protein IJZ85_07595 [Lachnospiraceae bacterium]|nr:hypothetical protein [Lachnospiraceae bacterium]